jgi:hypothetical protein
MKVLSGIEKGMYRREASAAPTKLPANGPICSVAYAPVIYNGNDGHH